MKTARLCLVNSHWGRVLWRVKPGGSELQLNGTCDDVVGILEPKFSANMVDRVQLR